MKEKLKSFLQIEQNLQAFLTLFSLGAISRGTQFLIPLVILWIFPNSKEVDSYFYWTMQSNLIATSLASIWPSALMSLMVKCKEKYGESAFYAFAGKMLLRYLSGALIVAVITGVLASKELLGGPEMANPFSLLALLIVTIVASSASLALSEIATAQRKFGVIYKCFLFGALVHLAAVYALKSQDLLLPLFALNCLLQVLYALWLMRDTIKLIFQRYDSSNHADVVPSVRIIGLLYFGGIFTLLVGHFSFRLLSDEAVGVIAAFAFATTLSLIPQQLVVQQLSTVAGVAMSEAIHRVPEKFARVSGNWRERLFKVSLGLALTTCIGAASFPMLLPYLPVEHEYWKLISIILVFLSLPIAASGLNNWNTRLTMAKERFEAGVFYQVVINAITLIFLFACAGFPMPYSTPLALALGALAQIVIIPIYQKIAFRN